MTRKGRKLTFVRARLEIDGHRLAAVSHTLEFFEHGCSREILDARRKILDGVVPLCPGSKSLIVIPGSLR